ncbi:DNA repair protein RecO [Ichthyobacterium seriolicida]|uniref:DNA repair protein RecO n=1 Tax=Ichthyobacterium seriolicida TaxID=242600 RepID=A0A1J1DZU0_9FLAO|nr:DNA repair protein RecO C-terminal domain-containing protein [Ichthyobacterium seriolicida]BAV95425.1 DNA repair protein RecO [Ichthyobacterium seriolicida]
MFTQTQSVVLNSLKYTDNRIILNCYTEKLGFKSYLVNLNNYFKKSYSQPLSQLNLIVYNRGNKLEHIREIVSHHIYDSIYTDPNKISVTLFLSEILTMTITDEFTNEPLFKFISNSIMWFDQLTEHQNFYLFFMKELLKYIGIYPLMYENNDEVFFDMKEGRCSLTCPDHNFYLENDELFLFNKMLKMDKYCRTVFTTNEKKTLNKMLISYYKVNLDRFKTPNSLEMIEMGF